MEVFEALSFIESLANGIDPITGQSVPVTSPLHHPQVIRSLFVILRHIESSSYSEPSLPNQNSRPLNAGQPWTDLEDQQLLNEFDTGMQILGIAEVHKRTRGAITSRLVRLGRLERNAETSDETTCNPPETEK
ncbi:MAG: hypothetical protein KDA84_03675, partial [Planctomycetaceae bacterium]|nr:hypothetical protein [Planctomycetaceae bacterium]